MSRSIFDPSRPRSRPHRRAAGFTLLEILTVISIIAILIGLLFAAMKYARNSAAQSRTKAQLDTLRGMLGELDAANHFSQSPPAWLWYNTAPASPPYITSSGSSDFFKYPYISGTYANSALDAPGDVGTDSSGQQTSQRNASPAIINTQLAMQMLAAIPGNKSAIDNLPANSKMMPIWNAGPVLQAMTGDGASTAFVGLLKEDGNDSFMSPQVNYVQGVHVAYQGKFYVCVVTPTTNSQIPGASGTTSWLDETVNSAGQSITPRGVPLLVDGWGNPIIYVPATGLHVKMLNGQGSYLPTDPPAGTTQEWIVISPEGEIDPQHPNGSAHPQVARPGRPFFASAGPDGDFTKGDDNLYSFNN